jgi:hypothetical protein
MRSPAEALPALPPIACRRISAGRIAGCPCTAGTPRNSPCLAWSGMSLSSRAHTAPHSLSLSYQPSGSSPSERPPASATSPPLQPTGADAMGLAADQVERAAVRVSIPSFLSTINIALRFRSPVGVARSTRCNDVEIRWSRSLLHWLLANTKAIAEGGHWEVTDTSAGGPRWPARCLS